MEERAIDRLRKFARYARDKGVVKADNFGIISHFRENCLHGIALLELI